jgi:hypothetical protein
MAGKRLLGRTGRRLVCVIAAAAIGSVVIAPTAARARPSAGAGTASGTCSVTPNPVAVLATYTVSGSHLPAGQIVSVTITDPAGTQWGSVRTTSTGTLTYAGQASVAGSYSVRITGGTKGSLLATCGFSAL